LFFKTFARPSLHPPGDLPDLPYTSDPDVVAKKDFLSFLFAPNLAMFFFFYISIIHSPVRLARHVPPSGLSLGNLGEGGLTLSRS